jgi:DinB superfamily
MSSQFTRALTFTFLMIPAAALAQQPAPNQPMTLSGQLIRGIEMLQTQFVESAARMPEEHYNFKPTPEIKPFGQLVAHLALSQFRSCAVLKGEPNPKKDEKEETSRSKAEAIALLKASGEYCAPLVRALTDTSFTELTTVEQKQVAKGLIPTELAVHGMEMYGTMAVYLRLKGLVPPMSEMQNQQMKKSQ